MRKFNRRGDATGHLAVACMAAKSAAHRAQEQALPAPSATAGSEPLLEPLPRLQAAQLLLCGMLLAPHALLPPRQRPWGCGSPAGQQASRR